MSSPQQPRTLARSVRPSRLRAQRERAVLRERQVTAPDYLNPRQRDLFAKLAAYVVRENGYDAENPAPIGLRLTLEMAVCAYDDFRESRRYLAQQNSFTYTHVSGNGGVCRALHPEAAVAAQAWKQLLVLMPVLFGVTRQQAALSLNNLTAHLSGEPREFTVVQGYQPDLGVVNAQRAGNQ